MVEVTTFIVEPGKNVSPVAMGPQGDEAFVVLLDVAEEASCSWDSNVPARGLGS